MSWGAHSIFTAATMHAVDWAAASPLAHLAHVVRQVPDDAWYRREWMHDAGPDGLLVLRRVGHPGGYGMKGGVSWNELISEQAAALDLDVSARLLAYLAERGMEDQYPPDGFRRWLQSVAAQLGQAVMFYSCSMWAGEIEHEYVLVYGEGEQLHTTGEDAPANGIGDDALIKGLAEVTVNLPTRYFALHASGFDWAPHALLKR